MEKIPEMYRTADGMEFENEADAEKHQAVLDTKAVYESAKQGLEFALVESVKTGDGKPFSFDRWQYWYVVRFFGFPDIRSVSLSRWGFEIVDIEEDDITIRVDLSPDHSKPNYTNFRISEIYTTELAAKRSLLKAQEEQLAEYKKRVKNLRESIKQQQPSSGEQP